MDEKTKEIYSRKFQFHMIELKKLKYVKEKQKKKPLYRWAKLIAAQTWEELEQESKAKILTYIAEAWDYDFER